ncbi:acyltransferase [Actinosynnema sp. NPDC020468]|uniref:acyltransferase family protein n=1 Tax=Actinosynnema sp. NPDC020468 TaxID=3154488 RepID=UPI0033FC9640
MAVTDDRSRDDPSTSAAAPVPAGYRTDVQALRAVAMVVVLLCHFWPALLIGGYVGLDVFFVISGFLITAQLDRELRRTGSIRLTRFYARRVRRLLPAATVVLLFCVVVTFLVLPPARWPGTAREVVASATYWENWVYAAHPVVDYLELSPVAHFWSLSIEEQFYVVLPLTLLVLFRLRRRAAQVTGIAVVGAVSLAYSAYYTHVSPYQAYFDTFARVWEFAVGALIALTGGKLVLGRLAAGLASATGLALVLLAAVAFDDRTPFPGVAALLPTAGAALVIVSGNRPGRQWHTAVSASRPVQFFGDITYSVYLWHWPLLLMAPFVLGVSVWDGSMGTGQRLGVLGVSVALGAVSKICVEDPGRTSTTLTRRPKVTFAVGLGCTAVTLLAATALHLAR